MKSSHVTLPIKKMSALLIIMALVHAPLAYAEEIGDPAPVLQPEVAAEAVPPTVVEEIVSESVVEEVVAVAEVPEEAVAPEESVVLQDAQDVQQTIATDVLEDTTRPLEVSEVPQGETVTIVVEEEVVIEESPIEENELQEVVAVIEQTQQEVPMVDSVVSDPVITEVPVTELVPEPEFSFALSDESVPTKKKVRTSRGVTEEEVSTKLIPTVDNEKGELRIEGQCSNVSFVVLLFKNEEDYARDPASYIVNRAYPCENGSFSYALSSLPTTLADGTYYLLVGEQGDKGMWTPITELRAVTINNSLR